MIPLVDTIVWSRALRRDAPAARPEVRELGDALAGSEMIVTTGFIIQELLQGFHGPKASAAIVERFSAFAFLSPSRDDYIAAAEVRNKCRRAGVQLGTVDALIAQLCMRTDFTLLTTDQDFVHAAKHTALKVWSRKPGARHQ